MSSILDQVLSLPPAEKIEMLDFLWKNIEADDFVLSDLQRDELDHRLAAYERQPELVIPWEQVREQL